MAPATAPPITFFASSPRVDSRAPCSVSTFVIDASIGYVFPSKRTDCTRSPRRAGSLTLSDRSTDVTCTTAVAPAGMTAPFEPCTALVTVAVKRSPGLCVFVQTRSPDRNEIVVPAPMLATRPSPPDGARSTTLPLGVVRGALGVVVRGGVVRGVDDAGRLTLPPLVDVD